MDKLQQNFLMSEPVMAESDTVVISPLKGYFTQQFKLNKSEEALAYWQVFDRTTGEEIKSWSFDSEAETVNYHWCRTMAQLYSKLPCSSSLGRDFHV